MARKSRILFIGGTGYIGKFIVEASVKAGHDTFLLLNKSNLSNPIKTKLIHSFKTSGVTFIHLNNISGLNLKAKYGKEALQLIYKKSIRHGFVDVFGEFKQHKILPPKISDKSTHRADFGFFGDMYDHESLVKAIKQVDVVISTVGHALLADQINIIAAIKEASNIKRFFPSEFGNDVDHVTGVEPAKTAFNAKAQIRRLVEAEGIPFTIVSNFFSAGFFLPNFAQPGSADPPKDKIVILGDGNTKAVFNKEEDFATYTIKAVDDPKTLNKILYVRPPNNIITLNEVVTLWEKKTGNKLERIYVSEEQVLKNIQEASFPLNMALSICYTAFVKGDHTSFGIDPSIGLEASEVYRDVKYTSVREFLDQCM